MGLSMNRVLKPRQSRCVLFVAASMLVSAFGQRVFDVSPGPSNLPASPMKYVRFKIASFVPGETVTIAFQQDGSLPDDSGGGCRIQFARAGAVQMGKRPAVASREPAKQLTGDCSLGVGATTATRSDGVLEATLPIAFRNAGHYKLYVRTDAIGWTAMGAYQMTGSDVTAPLGIQLAGVTPTQAVLSITPPAHSDFCQILVTSTKNDSGWDYSTLVPDTDPSIFPYANNANLNDAVNAPQNRGFLLPDGTLGIVIGNRTAEYSPYTYKMHSRALQAATPHEAWISCTSSADGSTSSGTIDFTTPTIMTGISYSDPLPADPDRPGDYAYPTVSWNNRKEGVVDPQTGVMMRPVSLPDFFLGSDFVGLGGIFGAPIPAYPAHTLPSTSLFIPVDVGKALPSYFNVTVDATHPAWGLADYSLSSFLPVSLTIGCPTCRDTPVTVCLTADGISCAQDRNVMADPNASGDPNTQAKGTLGVTFNCTGNCTFPVREDRWKDSSPVLAAWHPNYASGASNTVLPTFQFDSVKIRTSPVRCDGSALVYRGTDASGSSGAAFNPLWKKGTPVSIDSVRYTINQVTDENTIVINESCPSGAKNLVAGTFGILATSSVPLSGGIGSWTSKISQSMTDWDSAGDLQQFANCSSQSVKVGGQAGWHCQLGRAVYWIAADGSTSLPMGVAGVPYRADLGSSSYCAAAYWDDLDGNSLYCMVYAPNTPGKHMLARMAFRGDHAGLEKARYLSVELGGGNNSYLPVCISASLPLPNNCWSVSIVNATGTNSPLIIEDGVRDGALTAWNSSAFPAAMNAGAVYTSLTSKLDPSHFMLATWLGQNSYGFNAILELSTPRGTAKIRAVLPSWTAASNAVAGSTAARWAGIHDNSGDPWGATKTGINPTYFRSGSSPGQGPFYSNIVAVAPASCPAGTSGSCSLVTVDGQPGDPTPSSYDPINDLKTGKPGFGYLQDLAAGDLLCAPKDGDYLSYCQNYIQYGRFEDLRVVSVESPGDGTLQLTVQRNVGKTLTMPLAAGQKLFTMPSWCDFSGGYGCDTGVIVWDWTNGTVEEFSNGGCCHQFTAYDPEHKQVVSITDVAASANNVLCYSSNPLYIYPNCYSVLAGQVDSSKLFAKQTPALFQGLITMLPPFAVGTDTPGVTGAGTPNDVDSHPGTQQMTGAQASEKVWFADARPFLGFFTAPLGAPVQTAPDVYRFAATSGQDAIETYKRLPMMASCGMNVLREVTQISNQTPYAYCVAVNAGDCMDGSSQGDSYVSCPSVNPLAKASNACPFAGIGAYMPEVRDTCLMTAGPYTMGLTQMGFASQSGGIWSPLTPTQLTRSGRLLTHALQRYRIVDQYWNPKTTPDGGVLLFRVPFMNGYSTQIMMAKIPPFPDITQDPLDRRSYIPTTAAIDPAPDGATSVKVQFGYDATFRCISRGEPCEARASFDSTGLSTPYYFASEIGPDGLSCLGGCPASVDLPGISQRVIFYRPVYQVDGSAVNGPTRVVVVPDPTQIPAN